MPFFLPRIKSERRKIRGVCIPRYTASLKSSLLNPESFFAARICQPVAFSLSLSYIHKKYIILPSAAAKVKMSIGEYILNRYQ